MTEEKYEDFAIILTWPDATIRGDEKWMMFFKKIGLVKNLNFKVGHTGIVLVNRQSGDMLFYDFGRYISPRGYGRARSAESDPRLKINFLAQFYKDKIVNISDIVAHFENMKSAMYGEGILYFSIADGINFKKAKSFGDFWVKKGTYPYGAVAKNNNNCSRFITRILINSSIKYHFWHNINFPESVKASPISNVVNAVADRMIYSYLPEQGLRHFRLNRWRSLLFLIKQLGDNFSRSKSQLLPDDMVIGAVKFNSKPISIPKDAQYLGGVGDGAWYSIQNHETGQLLVKRFTTSGELEYVVIGKASIEFDPKENWEVTYDSHLMFTHVVQNHVKIRIEHIEPLSNEEFKFENIKELFA